MMQMPNPFPSLPASPGPQAIAMTYCRSCVDEEISRATLSLSDLCLRKDSFPPILRLPSELLEVIFIHGAQDYYHGDYSHRGTNFCIPSWVNVSYVCRLWRTVAINSATLWTYHFVVSLRWTEELLARSKQAPLRISINYHLSKKANWWTSLLQALLNQMERIQELRLGLPPTIFPVELSLCAPRLQKLEIEWPGSLNQRIVVTDEHVPSLHILKLVGCALPLSSTSLGAVTTLSLCRIFPTLRLNMSEFLIIIRRMEHLTTLHIEDALTCTTGFLSSGTFDALPKVNLRHLAHLIVFAPHSALVTFLSRVNMPLQTKVRLQSYYDGQSSIDDYTSVSSFLTQKFNISELSSPTIRSLIIYIRPWEPTFTFSASECDRDTRDLWMSGEWEPNIPLTITVQMGLTIWRSVDRIIRDMCRSMPSANIQSLHIVKPPFSPEFWEATLGHLDGLRYMKLKYGCMPNLASVLSLSRDAHAGEDQNQDSPRVQLFVPELEELELSFIEFAPSGIEENVISQKLLNDALAARKEPRPRLTMMDCTAERNSMRW